MSRVDRSALENGLQTLQQKGIIGEWSARPFGMYSISALGREILRPDTKETAMWSMGALHGHAMAEFMVVAGAELEMKDKRPILADQLDKLQGFAAIDSWIIDEDGNYALCLKGGRTCVVLAADMGNWLVGASEMLVTLRRDTTSPDSRKRLDEFLTTLREIGIIGSWSSDDDRNYSYTVTGYSEPTKSSARDAYLWATAAMISAHWFIEKMDDDEFIGEIRMTK